MRITRSLILLGVLGCASDEFQDHRPSRGTIDASRVVVFSGMCDASGAVPLDGSHFLVADDEDNLIRVFDADTGGPPLCVVDLSSSLGLDRKGKRVKRDESLDVSAKPERPARYPETDIEAATGTSEHAFWLTSHARDRKGRSQPSRFRFFATTLPDATGAIEFVGVAYSGLLEAILALPQLAPYELEKAAALPPKAPGGLNIEGLTAAPDGSVVIGFRSPLLDGKALVVWLLNPLDVLLSGEPASFGRIQQLELEGLGVRGISRWRGQFLLIGGSPGAAPHASRLFTWDGISDTPRAVPDGRLEGLNPEAFVSFEDREQVLVLSDDGTVQIDGRDCKSLQESGRKRFRGLWVRIDDAD